MKKRYIFILLLLILSIAVYKGIVPDVFEDLLSKPDTVDQPQDIDDEEDDEEDIVEEPKIVDIDLLAVGDIMFHSTQINSADMGNGGYDFNPVFEYVKDYIQGVDLALGNYETVSLEGVAYTGYPRFNSPAETIEGLKNAGFDIISTANNHSLDQGKSGIISTIGVIENQGLKHVGTNLDKDWQPLIVEVEGIRIGIMSYTYGLNGLDSLLTPEELSYMVNLIDEDKIQEEIQLIKSKDVDLILSYMHWGHEYHHEPSEYQQELAGKLVEWGVNIVLGSHPHVVQKSEIINHGGKDNLVVYSLGNFISNQREITMGNSYSEDGVMVKVNIEKNFDTNETLINEIEYIPTWVYRYSEGGRYHYEILPTESIIDGSLPMNLEPSIKNRIEKSYNDTINVFSGN